MTFETIHAASLALAIAADALAPEARGMFEDYEGDLAGLSVRDGGFERRPAMRNPNIKAARQECLRLLREDFEQGRVGFDDLLDRYQYVEQTARALAWHRWSEANGVTETLPLVGDEHEVENDSYHEDGRQWVPVREDWWAYEDHGFRPITPVGDVLAFGGVA